MEAGNKKFHTTIDCVAEDKKLTYEVSLWELSSNEENTAKRVVTRVFDILFTWNVSSISLDDKRTLFDIYLRILKVPQIESTLDFFQDDSIWKPLASRLICF